jgi:hypothetical protein
MLLKSRVLHHPSRDAFVTDSPPEPDDPCFDVNVEPVAQLFDIYMSVRSGSVHPFLWKTLHYSIKGAWHKALAGHR